MADTTPAPARPAAVTAHRIVVVLLPLLVLTQATLAGQHLFEGSAIDVHGFLGIGTFVLATLGVALALMARRDATAFFLAVALMALAFAQVGLGYVGRDSSTAAAWHIPVGVTIFGLTAYQLAMLRGAPPDR